MERIYVEHSLKLKKKLQKKLKKTLVKHTRTIFFDGYGTKSLDIGP